MAFDLNRQIALCPELMTRKLSDHIRQQGMKVLGRRIWTVDPRPKVLPDRKHLSRSTTKRTLRMVRQEYQDR